MGINILGIRIEGKITKNVFLLALNLKIVEISKE
jgi:hypothetical protein